jgi:probable F420-dependent oxidoreductase
MKPGGVAARFRSYTPEEKRMHIPRIGVGVPSFGPHASPAGIVAVAQSTERLGFHSVWTFERLLLPAPLDGDNPYGLPEHTASMYDPLETLTFVAAHTQRIRLGTSVLDALFHAPIVLARRLATLDRLSAGRVIAGIGQGWMPEEFTAAGVLLSRRGAGFEDYLAAMRACWAPDPVECTGRHYQIPRSKIGPKPIRGHVPLLIGGTSQPAIERAARFGDGFAAVFQDWDTPLADLLAWLCYTHWCWGKDCVVGDNCDWGTRVCLEHRCIRWFGPRIAPSMSYIVVDSWRTDFGPATTTGGGDGLLHTPPLCSRVVLAASMSATSSARPPDAIGMPTS